MNKINKKVKIVSITAHGTPDTYSPPGTRLSIHAVALIDTGAAIYQEIKTEPAHNVNGTLKESRLREIADEKIAELGLTLALLGFPVKAIEAVEPEYLLRG